MLSVEEDAKCCSQGHCYFFRLDYRILFRLVVDIFIHNNREVVQCRVHLIKKTKTVRILYFIYFIFNLFIKCSAEYRSSAFFLLLLF